MALVNKNGFKNFGPSSFHGPLYSRDYDSDGALWIPAVGYGISLIGGTWTATRNAAGDYSQVLTPAAVTARAIVDLAVMLDKIGADPIAQMPGYHNGALETADGTAPTGTANSGVLGNGRIKVGDDFPLHILRGIQLTGYDVVYTLGTIALTTHTGACYQTTYDLTHASGTVVTADAAQALGTATSANVLLSSCTIVAPYVIGNNASSFGLKSIADYLEIVIVNPGTTTYALYGVKLYFNYCLL